jgi:translation initiation factor 1 (eIF-1/SUI1)
MINNEIRDRNEEVMKFRLEQSKYGKWIFQIGNIDDGTDSWALSDDEVKSLAKLLKEKGF